MTPNWVVDSINMERLADEGEYRPRGRGRDGHLVQQGALSEGTDVQCNGDFTDTTGDHSQTKGSQEKTTEVHLEDYSHKLSTDPLVPIPFQDVTMEPAGEPATPTSDTKDHGQVQEVLTVSGAPLETAEGSVGVATTALEWGGEGMGDEGEGGEEDMEVMSGEGELQVVIALEEKAMPTTSDITTIPSITVRNGLPHTSTSAVDTSAQPVGGTGGHLTSRLLAGLVFHLTGYLECMEEDTLTKWKEVSSFLLVTLSCDLTPVSNLIM